MARYLTVEPVELKRLDATLAFMVAGRARGGGARTRAAQLRRLVERRRPFPPWAFRARRGRRTVAAAMAVPGVGRVGMIFASPADAPGVEPEPLEQVLRAAGAGAVTGGMAFAQSLTAPEASEDLAALERAGYRQLATLQYLSRDLPARPAPAADAQIVWRPASSFGEEELPALIARTYGGSLDCPGLAGLRSMEDVVAGHRAAGTYRPEWWCIAEVAGEPAGLILACESPGQTADVLYMGVVPGLRGRGLGSALVRHLSERVHEDGMRRLTLAVDERNVYAARIYQHEGFVQKQRRIVHVYSADSANRCEDFDLPRPLEGAEAPRKPAL